MTNTQNFVSAYVERTVTTPTGNTYTWAKTQGFTGNPEYIRYFPEKENPNYGNDSHPTGRHPKINALLAIGLAVENKTTLETDWKEVLIYDDPQSGFQPATELAYELLDLQPDGSNGPNVKTAFLKVEGTVNPYHFQDKDGNDRVKSKVRAKEVQCLYSKPYQPDQQAQQPTDSSSGRRSVFAGSQQPAQATQPATPTQHSSQTQQATQTAPQGQQPTVEQLQAQMAQLMAQMQQMQQPQPQQQPPEQFPQQPQFQDDVPF